LLSRFDLWFLEFIAVSVISLQVSGLNTTGVDLQFILASMLS
jgi:hypothetical protein